MKSVVLRPDGSTGRPRASLEDREPPKVGPGEVLVEMRACGICGTDLEKLKGEYTASMAVIGHEAVGVVSSVGEGVDSLKAGDRVFPHHHVSCGKCWYCTRGSETMCDTYRRTNLDPGGFAEFFRVPRENVARGGVLRIPDGTSFDEASMVEPAACCLRAIKRCGVSAGDSVLVVGAGPVGLTHCMLLRSKGAVPMISDVSSHRLAFADALSFGPAIDASSSDVSEEVRKKTGGRGADAAIVAAGSKGAIVQALMSVRKGGTVCLFGIPSRGAVLDYDFSDVFNSEVSVVSSYAATEAETGEALELIASGRVDLGKLVTHRVRLAEFQRGVDAALSGEAMKVIVTP